MNAGDVNSILDFLIKETKIVLSQTTSEIEPDASLSSLGFDSMSFVELLVSIERQFNVKLIEIGMSPEDTKTLRSLAQCVHRYT